MNFSCLLLRQKRNMKDINVLNSYKLTMKNKKLLKKYI